MENELPSQHESRKQSHFPWAMLILAVVVIVVAAFAHNACIKTVHGLKEIVESITEPVKTIIRRIPDAAEKFKTGTITRTFVEHIPEVSPTRGDVLELTTSRSDEEFTRSDSKSIAWNMIYLGTTVSTIRVPATFRYHLRLSDTWRLAARDKVCYVLAPFIRLSLPTAFQSDQMQKSTASGWARFNKDDNLAELERSITPDLDQRAGDTKHMKLVREACRQSVAEFVKKWLMKEDFWRTDRFTSIVVVFPDEGTISSDQELEEYHYIPTVKLDYRP